MRAKNVSKEATVAQYIEEFLKDRPAHVREEFRQRSVERQYSSIIQWRRNKRLRESTPRDCAEIIQALGRVKSMIENSPEISERDYESMTGELSALRAALDEYMTRQKARKIEALEQQSRMISERLQELRGY